MSKKSSSSSSLYPEVLQSNPDSETFSKKPTSSSSSSFYPSLDMKDLVDNLFPDNDQVPITTTTTTQTSSQPSIEETILTIPGCIVHLIDKQQSVELATGELTIVRLRQGDNVIAILLRIGSDIQWPLAKDEASVKLDQSHYFFSLRVPTSRSIAGGSSSEEDDEIVRTDNNYLVNYGLTIASKGQENLLKEFDGILEKYSSFSLQKVKAAEVGEDVEVEMVDGSLAKEMSPRELALGEEKKEMMKDTSAAYWTTLAPNVEDYSGGVARAIASGSGSLIKGILWCGDVTADRLKWGHVFLRKSMAPCSKEMQLHPATLRRIKRVKRITKMSEQVAKGILSGVVSVSGFFTGSVVNSAVGKKFFSLLPGEIVLASLDGFSKLILPPPLKCIFVIASCCYIMLFE
ncbi:hypothetical protein AQUCO_00700031v1 [Aquilegia coerulea]|uniref:Senescence domain-containing protein n=1 Tax=Aquilegia coerulea TaxID=218851 RepID=A0A2G5EIP4_AQUCA|nr:hypothetical protein AQUCO_00700031v1 [Aquilegia coerulea]